MNSRLQIWLAGAIVAAGLLLTAGLGVFAFISANSKPLHSDTKKIPSVSDTPPRAKWAAAASRSAAIARAEIAEQNLPGLSAAVAIDGQIVWAEGFGWTNIETRDLVDPSTRFRIGHVSVPLTAAGVGWLREHDRIQLDTDVQEYVPAFPRKQWPVTMRELMGNVAGVRHYRDTEWGDKPTSHCETAAQGLTAFDREPLLFQPETKYRYSTYGWVLVSAAVEAAAGHPFFEFMRDNVFAPIGMSHTGAEAAIGSNRATSYYRGNFGREITTDVDYTCFAGGGAFVSTPSDLVRFAIALNGGTFLDRDTVKMLQTSQVLISGQDTGYGLGWWIDDVVLAGERTRLLFHSSRTMEGASASLLIFPDRGLAVAAASNMSFADMKATALAIAQEFGAAPGT